MSSYPMQLQSLMQSIWNTIGLRGASFRVRDAAVGGHVGTRKLGPCVGSLIDNHDHHIDFVTCMCILRVIYYILILRILLVRCIIQYQMKRLFDDKLKGESGM